eukprot:GFYU01001546.1.p1 GENE.GFYU01001546.1~~GFYU01001546.1.p1  ORF type:complete len:252 (+),score=43.40 GFYU01001546.1:142-897(+)
MGSNTVLTQAAASPATTATTTTIADTRSVGTPPVCNAVEASETNATQDSVNNNDITELRWQHLAPMWTSGKNQFEQSGLLPPWKMFVFGDGSPTRHLHLLTGEPTQVDVISMDKIFARDEAAPASIDAVTYPIIRRQVWLTSGGKRMGYATSWWNAADVEAHMQDASKPIWLNLTATRTELYRDIEQVFLGNNSELENGFGHKGPFWGRHYTLYNEKKPLCVIYEVFSPELQHYLGPMTSSIVPSAHAALD